MPGDAAEFRDEPLPAILAHLQARLAAGDDVIELDVLDPGKAGVGPGEALTRERARCGCDRRRGLDSSFARVAKHEDPDLADAASRASLRPDARVLELGCNRGDTLALLAGFVSGLATRGTLVPSTLATRGWSVPKARVIISSAGLVSASARSLSRRS